MNVQDQLLANITRPLMEWFEKEKRPLPWRADREPYHVWVSEIMLQQTRIAAVLKYYKRFMKELPTIGELACAPEDRLLKLWQGLGYYNRARNLQKAAQIVVEDYKGVFPSNYEEIVRLPGIGEYTAGAIASICYQEVVPAVDGNVMRILARVLADYSDIALVTTRKNYREKLKNILPQDTPGSFNQALMELGERICIPGGEPLCDACPIRAYCLARQNGTVRELPVKGSAKARRVEERRVYLIFWNDRVALRKRPQSGLLSNLWEFPNELAEEDDIQKLCGISGLPVQSTCEGKHIFSHIEWHMTGWKVEACTELLPEGWVWAAQKELEEYYAIPTAFRFTLPTVSDRLKRTNSAEM